MERIITLTTDFGLRDEYVGVMKGVILCRAPSVGIVDLCHGIRPHDIRQAAALLDASYRFFPKATIHLVVVDPGVGGNRRLIAVRADNHWFLAPDNGVLTPMLDPKRFQAGFILQCDHLYLNPVSATFHGRDMLAPVAAQMAMGLNPAQLGPPLHPEQCVLLPQVKPVVDPERGLIIGAVVDTDHFGNLRTNIARSMLALLAERHDPMNGTTIIGTHSIHGISDSYDSREPGAPLAIIGSRDTLEICVNLGDAARLLKAGPNARVLVKAAAKRPGPPPRG